MVCIKDKEKETILVVSEQGYGKRSSIEDYRITNRGGKGVKTLNITEKTGKMVAIKNVTEENDIMQFRQEPMYEDTFYIPVNLYYRYIQSKYCTVHL